MPNSDYNQQYLIRLQKVFQRSLRSILAVQKLSIQPLWLSLQSLFWSKTDSIKSLFACRYSSMGFPFHLRFMSLYFFKREGSVFKIFKNRSKLSYWLPMIVNWMATSKEETTHGFLCCRGRESPALSRRSPFRPPPPRSHCVPFFVLFLNPTRTLSLLYQHWLGKY